MEYEKAFTLIVLSVSAWSSLALLLDRRGYQHVNRYFAALIATLCVPQLFMYSALISSPAMPLFGQLALASIWLKGPLILQLVQLLIGNHRKFNSIWWHFSGFPLALVLNILFPQTQLLWHFLGGCFSFAILLWSLLLLRQRQGRLRHIYAKFKNTAIFWLMFIVLGMLILLLMDAALFGISLYTRGFPFGIAKAIIFSISLYLFAVAFFSIYRPEVFFRAVSDQPESDQGNIPEESLAATVEVQRSLELSDSVAASLRSELERLMAIELLYKQDELSLANVAQALGISVHQTSELLNMHMRTSFYSYVNGYRLKHAARLLSDPNCQLRVLDILFESGFNNKNSFYREFRQAFGVTPTEYRIRQSAAIA